MDLNYLLIWLVCVSCGLQLWRCLQTVRSARGWAWVSGFILVGTGLMGVYRYAIAGYVGGLAWVALVLLPLIGLRRTNTLIAQHRFRAAARVSAWLRLLHPFDGWWDYPGFFRALAHAQTGDQETATRLLQRLSRAQTSLGRVAYCYTLRIQGDWPALRAWIDNQPAPLRQGDPQLVRFYLQALGETRALSEMVTTLQTVQPILDTAGNRSTWDFCCLCVFAYCGHIDMVKYLVTGPMVLRSRREKLFWQITAYQAAGQLERVHTDVTALQATGDLLYCSTLAQRDSDTWCNRDTLSDSNRHQLIRWTQHYTGTLATPPVPKQAIWKAPITILLVQLNVIAFVVAELMGGSTRQQTLYRLGAVVPHSVISGEWWRLLAGIFLHSGPLHLVLNMVALVFLGALVERQIGPLRFLFTYLSAGVGSMLVVTLLALVSLSGGPTDFVVGASGAVMGMIGAEAAILLRQWWRQRSPVTASRLGQIGLIIALQTVFDLTTPNISVTGHLSGLILGFLVCGLIVRSTAAMR